MAEPLRGAAGSPAARPNKPVGQGLRLIKGDIDGILFTIVIALLAIGLTMMFSASYPAAIEDGQSGTFYAVKQLKFAGAGFAIMLILTYCFDYRRLDDYRLTGLGFLVALVLMVLVLFVGVDLGTFAQRWLVIPGTSTTFQPSELMKLALVIFLSLYISRNAKANRMHLFGYGVLIPMMMLGIIAVLMILQPHLSGTIIILALGVVLLLVGGTKFLHLAVPGAIVVVAAAAFLLAFDKFDYISERFLAMQDPFNPEYMQDETWQTSQSLIAIGSGGFFGLGLGASRQKYQYLPEAQNDFVFAVLCEECGFVGAATVILLFCLLIVRGFYIASKAPDRFGKLVATGITVHIGMQALLNIAVVSNMLPNTGISLPFFSYGGTALIMQLAEMGLLLNISRQSSLE